MRITDIILKIYRYVATIKIKYGNTCTTTRTIIYADGMSQAKALLVASYGENSVLAIFRVTEDQLEEAAPNRTRLQAIPTLLPNAFKHDLAQKALVNQMKRNSLIVKPTIDDIEVARSDHEAEQKRVNHEYEQDQKWAAIRKRRFKKALNFSEKKP